eukprot:GEZU01010925.1.p1 GENE.GEZU01010925.1~~GEZU01010925.1.p1  ORF type:complete len:198 (-),score=13.02 GEZU01010925.1:102-695(-)
MEPLPIFYDTSQFVGAGGKSSRDKSLFVETASGNKVSRGSVLCGIQRILINGKTIISNGAVLRGDLANITMGRYCYVGEDTVIRPPFKKFRGGNSGFFPLFIGDHVFIDSGCVVQSAQIGSFVKIGKNCVIGPKCILKEACCIADNTVLPPETVVPPYTLWAGNPGKIVEELPECTSELHKDFTINYYERFIATFNK